VKTSRPTRPASKDALVAAEENALRRWLAGSLIGGRSLAVELLGADIAAAVFRCELDPIAERVGLRGGLAQRGRERGDTEDAAAVGDDLAVGGDGGAGVEDVLAGADGARELDRIALGIFSGYPLAARTTQRAYSGLISSFTS
jgi:hypothetical protein